MLDESECFLVTLIFHLRKVTLLSIFCVGVGFVVEKRTYNGLPDFMTKVAREELNKLSSSITECNVIYLPQVNTQYSCFT